MSGGIDPLIPHHGADIAPPEQTARRPEEGNEINS